LRAGFTTDPDLWLSEVLGRPALRLIRTDQPSNDWKNRLASEDLFVTARLPVEQVAEAGHLQDCGFRTIDAALTFEAGRMMGASDSRVRFARIEDRTAVTSIAGRCFVYSRFHLDPVIPKRLAHELKASWAASYFAGKRGNGMVVAEHDGEVRGFLQLIWADDVLVIDLIAVAPEAARRGLAKAMIGFAAAHGTGGARCPISIRVGTQAANVPSVRLYESLGFRLTQACFVLHHHGRGGPYPPRDPRRSTRNQRDGEPR
jgi:ribosomal protein S18 acetylase RimI-like enzyme